MKASETGKNMDRQMKRQARIFVFLCSIVIPWLLRPFRLQFDPFPLPEGGNLIIANHVTVYDQFFLIHYFKRHMIHFVAGENFFRNRFLRWIAVSVFGLIVHTRGVSSLRTVKEMRKRLKAGANVMIFPEGTTSFDGATKPMDPSIGKLAKGSGANLVIVRIAGGYLSRPRWGQSIRTGEVRLSAKAIAKEALAQMLPQEITAAINEYGRTDAYEEQEARPVKFIGKHRCLGLESCLYECPKCRQIGGLKSTDTDLFCDCEWRLRYDEYGYLTEVAKDGSNLAGDAAQEKERHRITEYTSAQKAHLKELLAELHASGETKLLFTDTVRVSKLYDDARTEKLGTVKLSVYSDRVEYEPAGKKGAQVQTGAIALSEADYLFVYLRNTVNCGFDGRKYGYEITGDFSFNALKYRDLFELIRAEN